MIDSHHGWNKSFKPSFLGLIFSLLLIFAAYRIVVDHHLTGWLLNVTIAAFAMIQAFIQLVFFLHLGLESKPRWNSITFLFALLVIVIIIGGSLWIMNNLNYNLMPGMTS